MKKLFKGKATKGKVVLNDQQTFNLLVWSLEGKEIEMTIGKPSKPRSNQENRYYWGVCIKILCEHTGYTPDEMHDSLRMLFLRDEGRQVPTLKSTAGLSTVSFEKYMSRIREWASCEMSVYIPEPGEVEY